MAILNQKKNLNVIPGITPQLTVHCSQSDEGSTVEFELYAGPVFKNLRDYGLATIWSAE